MSKCPFCDRIDQGEVDWISASEVASFEPLSPVTPGHRLFLPVEHAIHPDGGATADAMMEAELWGGKCREDFNLITSSGPAATQTVPHIHIHYVPRRSDDGLYLPWTGKNQGDQ